MLSLFWQICLYFVFVFATIVHALNFKNANIPKYSAVFVRFVWTFFPFTNMDIYTVLLCHSSFCLYVDSSNLSKNLRFFYRPKAPADRRELSQLCLMPFDSLRGILQSDAAGFQLIPYRVRRFEIPILPRLLAFGNQRFDFLIQRAFLSIIYNA